MKPILAVLATTLILGLASTDPAAAQDGYKLALKLTAKDATHDPDGVWTDDDLAGIRQAVGTAKIYTARIATPSGTWLLSQTNGDCNLQGMCTALLVQIRTGTPPTQMANPQMPLGGTAILSPDTRKLTTSEIGENGKAFTGSYEVEPIR
ncbi:hypothetical protein [Rhizobium rhizogenes]|jgi:hypothetical protein|uniref:Uncharacterized protein n=1 Tax=Rhizobium rhizogenes NBRC 13257 TaxID=1220581 RepID=A0AA87QF41_RHIRH|nr:hypothetical protein [Rhizobium rhizogenes]NTG71506.1 hypothetical protein [Rhizobium rhizogenes]NTG90602.1 hypothetical protein [Rhizobium rhizogenes]TRB03424.1 hypothetical protein EXN67_29345 [Rhizobium rhizogenes]TRB38166.1 hypothetical protein EXN73_28910 [Rhizobium rhizogenes]TRB53177.1 hypothetical protein EXN71_28895 [Rhizobium rhizogenes]